MFLIHPLTQVIATLLAIYVLKLGVARFRRLHFQHKTVFNWKRHVFLGKITLLLWFFGLSFGFIMVKTRWHGLLITGPHGTSALYFLPLLITGFGTGLYMDRQKKQRVLLPLIHAGTNILIFFMALLQAVSGWQVYNAFVLGN